jgi:hypothetical protein
MSRVYPLHSSQAVFLQAHLPLSTLHRGWGQDRDRGWDWMSWRISRVKWLLGDMETIFDSEAASRTFKISLQPSGTGNGKIPSRSETGQPPYDIQGD